MGFQVIKFERMVVSIINIVAINGSFNYCLQMCVTNNDSLKYYSSLQ